MYYPSGEGLTPIGADSSYGGEPYVNDQLIVRLFFTITNTESIAVQT